MFDTTLRTALTRRCLPVPTVHWIALWRSRRALARLEPHMLRDIGVTHSQASAEVARPLWDAPAPWRQVG